MEKVTSRFLNYVKYDTQSDPNSDTFPSTNTQLTFAEYIMGELKEINLQDITLDKNGYIMATLPANTTKAPTIGFISHMDTSPDYSGKNINPQIVNNYDGKDIILNSKKNIILSPKDFSELKNYIGEDIITTDGTTLLGADDKAGIAEIITAIEYLSNHPEIKHGAIKIAFTPDEEIGKGADLFDVDKFNADYAYTVDGGELGELEYENFNASVVTIKIQGNVIHTGSAKNKMINSMLIAMELNNMLPLNERPEYTEGYEGFNHLLEFKGTVEETYLQYIVRDHDKNKFKEKNDRFLKIVNYLNDKYGKDTISIKIKDQYYNMKEKIEPVMEIVENAKKAMLSVNVTPKVSPIRGGTDGARLSYLGLPCPNLFTGGHNFHGKYEYIPINSMQKSVEVIIKIIELSSK